MKVLVAVFVLCWLRCGCASPMPLPFTRVLSSAYDKGNDVLILQHLIERSPCCGPVEKSGSYDAETKKAVISFQNGTGLSPDGVFGAASATMLLELCMFDGYRDDGTIPDPYLYKVHIPVCKDRSIETKATLMIKKSNETFTFIVRTHGQNAPSGDALNQLSNSGNTPTGLCTFDLNSPEDPPESFGPYPINRFVSGLEGNLFVASDIRDGLLMHTGEWKGWDPSQPMPNSHGCVHGHPDAIKKVWQMLTDAGIEVHQNPGGKLPYPYKPQGLVSVEQINC